MVEVKFWMLYLNVLMKKIAAVDWNEIRAEVA